MIWCLQLRSVEEVEPALAPLSRQLRARREKANGRGANSWELALRTEQKPDSDYGRVSSGRGFVSVNEVIERAIEELADLVVQFLDRV